MSTSIAGTEARRYLEGVRTHLAYLPLEDRDELLEDLEAHLLEVAAENDGTLEQRLGPAPAYAEELRVSAGLPGPRDVRDEGLARRIAASRPIQWASTALESNYAREARKLIREVGPGWWLLRGYLAVLTPTIITSAGNVRENVPYPHVGSYAFGVVLVVLAGWFSWMLGRRGQRERIPRIMSLVLTGAVAIATIGAFAGWRTGYVSYYEEMGEASPPPHLHHADGTTIANICPYSADGKLLAGVLLFDQLGRPITNTADTADDRAIEQAKPAILNVYPKAISFVEFRGETYDPVTGETVAQKSLTPLQCPAAVTAAPGVPTPTPSTTAGP